MASLTSSARQLIDHGRLGPVVRVYGPRTVSRLFGAVFVAAFGVVFAVVAAVITGSDVLGGHRTDNGFPPFVRYFPLLGGLFVIGAVALVVQAFALASSRIVLCQQGLAVATRRVREFVRWPDVLSVHQRTDVTQQYNSSGAMTTGNVRHRAFVRCRDGRELVLDS